LDKGCASRRRNVGFRTLAAEHFSAGQLPVGDLDRGDKIRVIGQNIIYSGNFFMYLNRGTDFSPSGSCLKET
jgi:hypothetical protein